MGENIGARLQADQAEADTRVARAKAEGRRALAMAREQEMKAEVAKNRALVVLAEAEVPMAMAHAFREGNLAAGGEVIAALGWFPPPVEARISREAVACGLLFEVPSHGGRC